MNHNFKCFFLITLIFTSCISLKRNKEYATDYNILNEDEFAKKYFTLYKNQNIDFTKVKKDEAYLTYNQNATFQIIVFCENGYFYRSQKMSNVMREKKIPTQKLLRGDIFSIENEIIKFESKAPNSRTIHSIIREGVIITDTIFMKKKYNANGYKNRRNLFSQYFLVPDVNVYKLGNDYFIESK